MRGIRVNSLFEAIEYAEKLKAAGTYDLFRGQPRDWRPLRSSLARRSPEEQVAVADRLSRFAEWADKVPEMPKWADNQDELLAVAQHYAIPTHYMDFTTEPRIAAFFAADALPPDLRDDESSCIICVSSHDLSEFWTSIQTVRPEWPEPRVIRVHVPELWRLQAQRGCFIFLPYDNFEWTYDFDRIYFPPHRGEPPVPKHDVYPIQKSALEIAIDRFFMLEQMSWNEDLLKNAAVVSFEAPPHGIETECFGPQGLPRHPSWADEHLAAWAKPAAESWLEYSRAPLRRVEIPAVGRPPQQVIALAETLFQQLLREPQLRQGPVAWRCEGHSAVEDSLRLFWDGTRRWPYSVEDVALGLALAAVFSAVVARSDKAPRVYSDVADTLAELCLGGDCIEVEIGMSDGSYTRGYARCDELQKAVRDDFSLWLTEQWRPKIHAIRNVIQIASAPDHVFDFKALARTFVREIVPTQVVLRGEQTGKARIYNVARASSFGLP